MYFFKFLPEFSHRLILYDKTNLFDSKAKSGTYY